MEDASTSPITPAVVAASVPKGVRWRFLFGLAAVFAGLIWAVHRFGYDAFAMGWDMRFAATSALIAIGLILAFFLGGFSWRGRIVFLMFMGVGVLVLKLLVRKINVD